MPDRPCGMGCNNPACCEVRCFHPLPTIPIGGAAGMVNIPPAPPPPAPKPPAGFEEAVAHTARILAAGMKPPEVDAATLIDAGRTRHREVRAAYEEGCATGSIGFMDKAMCEEAWRYSDARKSVIGNPPGRNLIGVLVLSDDPRAAGREAWTIAGVDGTEAWIRSAGKETRIDLIVPFATLRAAVGRL